ncbi:MAG: ECF transporter S component [Oscillospiraceae bacterium]
MKKQIISTRKLTAMALFAAISTILMYIEVPIPFMPPFLKLDVSAVPIMVGAFAFGPVEGVVMALIKSLVHLLSTQTMGVGELADFLITGSFALTAGLIYRKNKTKKEAVIACFASIISITVMGTLANYFILLPFYAVAYHMPLEAVIATCSAVNPAITSLGTYILLGIVPFNLLKGTVVAVLTFIVYKKISVYLHKYISSINAKPNKSF